MRRLAILLLAGILPVLPARASADTQEAQGRALAEQHCASCHAIAGAGPSPVGDALPFSRLSERYPVENLAESLAEGILVVHPNVKMPEFEFSPEDVEALLAYLRSVQR
ncbi:c-type cytochrome [Arenibaculum pallidiluteum]|uniref:c-type cytochrome n=1 Tax=Arenibaculum pallidiluteum TaxID=2812559 RepID=UPI001A96CB96|nr:cytochrome c [Arenibaculum pallidiluteum]